jgi:hypothetical protein
MARVFLFVIFAGLIAAAIALLAVGAFPPKPHPQPVQTVLPNDSFQQH